MSEYFGKYRGRVANNLDPDGRGRLQVEVPAVLGEGRESWALPCMPYAGPLVGFFAIPPVGASIWVEFEGGDPESPIWSGAFWEDGDTPPSVSKASPEAQTAMTCLETESARITLDDGPNGGLTIEARGLTVVLSDSGFEITNGTASIAMNNGTVSINRDGLEVT